MLGVFPTKKDGKLATSTVSSNPPDKSRRPFKRLKRRRTQSQGEAETTTSNPVDELNLPQHQNFSGKNDGSYFHWRILVIEHIHKANLPITEKQALLRRACNLEQNDILKSIFDHT